MCAAVICRGFGIKREQDTELRCDEQLRLHSSLLLAPLDEVFAFGVVEGVCGRLSSLCRKDALRCYCP
jgi:hypothetical protein